MRTLVRVEIRRLLTRRASRVVAGAILAAIVVAGPVVFLRSSRTGGPAEFHLTRLTEILPNLAGLLIVAGLLLGASSVGAEWHHRTLTTTLTWEPRRARVALAKLIAAAVVVAAGATLAQGLLSVSLAPAAWLRGTTAGADAAWVGRLAASVLRAAAAAGIAATVGAAAAMIGRTTAAAAGAAFGWLAVAEGVIRGTRPRWRGWLIGDNVAGLVAPGPGVPRTTAGSGLVLALYTVALAGVAVLSMRRRDVG